MGPSNTQDTHYPLFATHRKDKAVEAGLPTPVKKKRKITHRSADFGGCSSFSLSSNIPHNPFVGFDAKLIKPLVPPTPHFIQSGSRMFLQSDHNQMWVNESLQQTQLQENNTKSYVGKLQADSHRWKDLDLQTGMATHSEIRWECSVLVISHFWLYSVPNTHGSVSSGRD